MAAARGRCVNARRPGVAMLCEWLLRRKRGRALRVVPGSCDQRPKTTLCSSVPFAGRYGPATPSATACTTTLFLVHERMPHSFVITETYICPHPRNE